MNKEKEDLKFKGKGMKNKIIEIENSLKGTNSRIEDGGEWIGEVTNRLVEITDTEKKKLKKNEKK